MTPTEADHIINSGKPATVYNTAYDETFTRVFVRRTRFNIITEDGEVFDRAELEIRGATP